MTTRKRSAPWYVRDPLVVAVGRADSILFVAPGRDPFQLAPIDTLAISTLLRELAVPRPATEIKDHATARTLTFLVNHGVLITGSEAALRARVESAVASPHHDPLCRRIVVGVSGTIESMHAAMLLRRLQRDLCPVIDVILTQAACRFVDPRPFAHFGIGVWTGEHEKSVDVRVPHIELAQSADVVLVYPASASTIQRLASGACSDLLSLVVTATAAPVVVVPSMNAAMWRHPAVARNVAQLRDDGAYVIEPSLGYAASKGPGAEPHFGGAGVGHDRIATTLTAILAAHRASR